MIIEMVLTARQLEVIDELERHWRDRETTRSWDDSDEVCERLLKWLRGPESPMIDRIDSRVGDLSSSV